MQFSGTSALRVLARLGALHVLAYEYYMNSIAGIAGPGADRIVLLQYCANIYINIVKQLQYSKALMPSARYDIIIHVL